MRPQELRLRLAAILAADAVGYSRLMSVDAHATIEALETARSTFQTISVANGGRVVDTAGDSVLAIFKTAAGAAAAALAIQHELETRAKPRGRPPSPLSHRPAPGRRGAEGRRLRLRRRRQRRRQAPEHRPGGRDRRLRVDSPGGPRQGGGGLRGPRGSRAEEHRRAGSRAPPRRGRSRARTASGPLPPKRHRPRWWRAAVRRCATSCSSAAVVASAVALAAWFRLSGRPGRRAATPADLQAAPLSILVLPFADQTGDEKKAYIADALTMSITADLSRIRDAFVVPAATAFTYRTKGLTVQQVAKDAAVRFVLGGSVLTNGQDVRVTAQLMDAKTGAQLWSETFKGELSDLFALQDQVTALVGNSIGERMVIVAARESETRKSAPQVVDLMLRARALNFRPHSIESFRERERLYREALAQEPGNVNAMVGLATTLAIHSQWMDASDPARDKQLTDARDLALKVKAIDPGLRRDRAPALPLRPGTRRLRRCAPRPRGSAGQGPEEPAGYGNFASPPPEHGRAGACRPLLKQALSAVSQGQRVHLQQPRPLVSGIGKRRRRDRVAAQGGRPEHEIRDVYSGLAMAYSNKGDSQTPHATLPSIRSGRAPRASRGSKPATARRGVRRPT